MADDQISKARQAGGQNPEENTGQARQGQEAETEKGEDMSTKIQWTEETWNPIAGCSVVSPGCTNCYAMRRTAPRLSKNPATPQYHGSVQPSKGGYVWTGKIGIAGDTAFLKPLRIKRPTMFFVNSMSDLFHENVRDDVIDRIFAVMALCPQHTFQILTKRSARMREYMSSPGDRVDKWFRAMSDDMLLAADTINPTQEYLSALVAAQNLPSVWLGVSVEDQTRADERIPDLLATPAAVRFISAEPLLGPVKLYEIAMPGTTRTLDALNGIDSKGVVHFERGLDWVIVGGESGKGARPMNPQWARDIRDQCAESETDFFHKQNGEWLSVSECEGDYPIHKFDDHRCVRRVGTKAAGRLLDGIEHNAMPDPA